MSKKRNIIATSLAAVLAVMLLAGGTIAYLTDSTGEVTNTFATNQNDVTLEESTGDEYDIVPGTSQEKDPTVTATYTLDSYVFVEVTDATDNLVEWDIASGWTLLPTTDNTDGSTTYVYYMLLETADVSSWTESSGTYTYTDTNGVEYTYNSGTGEYTAVIPVLDGNTVSYSSSLTNADMENIDSVSLTFQASIIQAELSNSGTVSPAAAYAVLNGGTYVENVTTSDLKTTLSSASTTGTTVIVMESGSSSAGSVTVAEDTDVYLELNGNYVSTVRLAEGSTLTLTDSGDGSGVTKIIYATSDDATLILDGVTVKQVNSGSTNVSGASSTVYIEDGTTVTYKVQTSTGGTTIINGGTIKEVVAQANTSGGTSTTIINGGTITSATAQLCGEMTINGGSFTYVYSDSNATLTINGGTFGGESYCLYCFSGTTYIYGGTFTGNVSVSSGTLEIYGGTFSWSLDTLNKYIASGYKAVDNGDGTYTVVADTTD